MAIGLMTGWPRDRGSFLDRIKIFFSTQSAQTSFLFQLELWGGGVSPKRSRLEPHYPPPSVADNKNNCTSYTYLSVPLLDVYRKKNVNFYRICRFRWFWGFKDLISQLLPSNKNHFKIYVICTLKISLKNSE